MWSYSAGRVGINRVRVYERKQSPCLYIEWYDDQGRHQRALRSVVGHPVTDRQLAMRIADRVAVEQEAKRNLGAAQAVMGFDPTKTLKDLLDDLHDKRGPSWSDSHARDQDRYKKFWLSKLGPKTPLPSVTEAIAESIALAEARVRDWSPRTHGAVLRYLKDAYSYAHLKRKWISGRHALTALDIPRPRSQSRPYALREIPKLLRALEEVDPIAGFIGHTIWQSGRRPTAIRTLPKSAVESMTDMEAVVRFPAESSKAKRTGIVILIGDAHRLLGILMGRPGKWVCQVGKGPARLELMEKEWLPRAEEIAGIEHEKYRNWYGIKRAYATSTQGLPGRDIQADVDERTLDNVYRQDSLDAKRKVAQHQAEVFS